MTTIQQLRELEAKAIPAPWYAGSFGGIDISGDGYEIIEFHKHPEPDGIATKPDGLGNSTVISSGSGEYAADAPSIKFAADLRNAAPYLFAVVEAAEKSSAIRIANLAKIRGVIFGNVPMPSDQESTNLAESSNMADAALDAAIADLRNAK